jgi:hypothetical protein
VVGAREGVAEAAGEAEGEAAAVAEGDALAAGDADGEAVGVGGKFPGSTTNQTPATPLPLVSPGAVSLMK